METPAKIVYKACATKIRKACVTVINRSFTRVLENDAIKSMIITTRRERVLAHIKAKSNAEFARYLRQEHQKMNA